MRLNAIYHLSILSPLRDKKQIQIFCECVWVFEAETDAEGETDATALIWGDRVRSTKVLNLTHNTVQSPTVAASSSKQHKETLDMFEINGPTTYNIQS